MTRTIPDLDGGKIEIPTAPPTLTRRMLESVQDEFRTAHGANRARLTRIEGYLIGRLQRRTNGTQAGSSVTRETT